MPLTTSEIVADLPALLDFLSSLRDAIETTKGHPPVARDFEIAEIILPKLKALVIQIDAQIQS
jgi:hypothetical protein